MITMEQNDEAHKLEMVSVRLVKDAPLMSGDKIENAEDAVKLLGEELCTMDRECVAVICMNSANQPICCSFCSIGTVNEAMFNPREVFKTAILANASNMILVHNHPSGFLAPSRSDTVVTDRMLHACEIMGFSLLDHVIVGGDNKKYYSFYNNGIIHYKPKVYEQEPAKLKFKKRDEDELER